MPDAPVAASLRSAQQLLAFIAARNVEKDPRYQPNHPAQGVTWCNLYVQGLLQDLEVPFPTEGWFAHQQLDFLNSNAGVAAGWEPCAPGEAVAFANKGLPVVVGYRNPQVPPFGHSHIALVVPSPSTLEPHITQAGAHNYADCGLPRGFGTLPVLFHWHL